MSGILAVGQSSFRLFASPPVYSGLVDMSRFGARNLMRRSSRELTTLCFIKAKSIERSYQRNWTESSQRDFFRCPVCFQQIRAFRSTKLQLKQQKSRRKYEPVKLKTKKQRDFPVLPAWPGITIQELAKLMKKDEDHVFECLLETDYADLYTSPKQRIVNMVLLNQLAKLSGFKLVVSPSPSVSVSNIISKAVEDQQQDVFPRPPADSKDCVPRPPVVTIMGHVDHGKTTLLDALRDSQIVDREFGGITQHIGAFSVKLSLTGKTITFLDTPGHAAFHSMRQRGAKATDIVVLVVAAEDGVMEQTVESIRFAKEARVPIVVAVNKCDKYQADPERAKRDLLKHDVVTEDFDGDSQAVCISALKRTNLTELQEAILTQAELMSLTSVITGLAEGVVIESRTAHGYGKLCTVLVQRGMLKRGKFLVGGTSWCKVRTLHDENLNLLNQVCPGFPAEVSGWRDDMPSPGDIVLEVESEQRAKSVAAYRKEKKMEKRAEEDQVVIAQKRAEDREEYEKRRDAKLAKGIRRGRLRDPNYIKPKEAVYSYDTSLPCVSVLVKGDVDGSVEAIVEVMASFYSHKCRLDLVDFGVGPPTESEIILAAQFKSIVYCFNVTVASAVQELAETNGVEIRHFNVIYRLVADLMDELTQRLPPLPTEEILGQGIVLKEFLLNDRKKKTVAVAGCRVNRGVLNRKNRFKFRRGDEVYFDGECLSMKREKETVNSATTMEEVGIVVDEKSVRFEPDDIVECYQVVEVPQTLDWAPPGF